MLHFDDIHELAALEVDNQRVFVRADLDCPLDTSGELLDDSKILAAAPTLRWLIEHGARVVVGGHVGVQARPLPGIEACGLRLAELLDVELIVPDENIGPVANKLMAEQRSKQIVLLDNLARDRGEIGADEDYARQLAAPFDVYVGDALFGPERYSSLVTMPKFCRSRGMGLRLHAELSQLDHVLSASAGAVWLINGSFAERKDVLDRALRNRVRVLPGALLGQTLLAASNPKLPAGPESAAVGQQARRWLNEARAAGLDLLLPSDWLCLGSTNDGKLELERTLAERRPGEPVLDLGAQTVAAYLEALQRASRLVILDGAGTPNAHSRATDALVGAALSRHAGSYILADAAVSKALREAGTTPQGCFVSTAREGVLSQLGGRRNPALDALRIPT